MGKGSEELGKLQPGDEVWRSSDPFIVHINRLHERADLTYSTRDGATVNHSLGIDTALGLIRDLGMKLVKKESSPRGEE